MDSAHQHKNLVILTLALFLLACGGSGGNSDRDTEIDFGPVQEFEISPGGIWYTIPEPFIFTNPDSPFSSIDDSNIIGGVIVSEENAFLAQLQSATTFFISETGELFIQHQQDADPSFSIGRGQITRSDSNGIEGGYVVETFRIDFEDSTSGLTPIVPLPGLCQLDGSLVEGSALYLTSTCEYEDGSGETFVLDLIAAEDCASGFCSVSSTAYENPFSLTEIAGEYESAFFGIFLSIGDPTERLEISSSGVISGSNGLGAGCAINGQISIIDDTFNLYEINWSLSECDIAAADGSEVSGLAAVRAFGDSIYLETIAQIESDHDDGPEIIAIKHNYLRLTD